MSIWGAISYSQFFFFCILSYFYLLLIVTNFYETSQIWRHTSSSHSWIWSRHCLMIFLCSLWYIRTATHINTNRTFSNEQTSNASQCLSRRFVEKFGSKIWWKGKRFSATRTRVPCTNRTLWIQAVQILCRCRTWMPLTRIPAACRSTS